MSKLKCSETFVYDAYVLYYNKLDIKELEILKEFLSDTKSNITKLINEYRHSSLESILTIDSIGFETKVLDNEVIIKIPDDEQDYTEYIVMTYDEFESTYKIEK